MELDPASLKRSRRYRAIAAALLGEQGKSQIVIVHELNRIGIPVSQPEVSRLLVQGETEKIYAPNPRVLLGGDGVQQEEWDSVMNWFYRDEDLEAILAEWCPEVKPVPYVVKAPELRIDFPAEEKRTVLDAHFYPVAATFVRDLLVTSKTIGVLWGRTVSNLIEALRAIVLPSDREVKVLPLCGEPLFLSNVRQSHY